MHIAGEKKDRKEKREIRCRNWKLKDMQLIIMKHILHIQSILIF